VTELKIESHKIVLSGPARIRIRDKKDRLVLELTTNGGTIFITEEQPEQLSRSSGTTVRTAEISYEGARNGIQTTLSTRG
jgi:hypothetical protein